MADPTPTGSRRAARAERVAVVALGAAMIATPLLRRTGRGRVVLAHVVVGGLFAASSAAATRRWGPRPAVVASATTFAATAAIEKLGTATGVPFGRYAYGARLQPQVLGVPVAVPLAWFGMALPSRETAHAALGQRSSRFTRVAGGSALLTAWDLFLDPQMVGEGYWRWARSGGYRGIPLTNFLGWLATGAAVMAWLERVLPLRDRSPADPSLVGTYGWIGALETLGFAAFFRDPMVAVAGGAAMLPAAAVALRRVLAPAAPHG